MPSPEDLTLQQAMEEALAKMDDSQRDHFKWLCAALLACYTSDDMRALVVIGQDDQFVGAAVDLTQMQSVNCNDMHATQLLAQASTQIGHMLMAEAPPRGMYH